MDFDRYLDILSQDQTPFDEVAIVVSAHLYKIHICIVMQEKYWTTKRDHDNKHCTLFLAYVGGMVFYSTTRKDPEPEMQVRGTLNSRLAGVMTREEKQRIIDTFNDPRSSPEHRSPSENKEPDDSCHGTRCTLSSKLSGVTDPDEKSRIIQENAEDMTRPPPKPTGEDPIPGANKPVGKAPKGNLVFVTHGIRKIQKRVHNFVYRVHACEELYHTQKDLNDHIRQDHSDFKFKCRHCTRVFMTANAAYKHEVGHAGKKFACKYYNKAFQFKDALRDHLKVHSGKGMHPCTNLDLGFASNWAMLRHAMKHQGKTYLCAKCPKNTSSPHDMRQHICHATTRPPRPSSTAECLRLIARLRGEQASAASWEPRPPFEATEMD